MNRWQVWWKNSQQNNESKYIEKLKQIHKSEIDRIKEEYEIKIESIQLGYNIDINKLNNQTKLFDNKGRISPEVCEIDLSLALPGNSENLNIDDTDSSYNSSKNIKNEKENFFEKYKSKQIAVSGQNKSKAVQKQNQFNTKLSKDQSKSGSQRPSNNEFENLKKQHESLKNQLVTLKNSEKKLTSDNTLLVQKVKSLTKENNELKHRIAKLTKIKNMSSRSPSTKRVGSCTAKITKNLKETDKKNLDMKKNRQVLISPWMKRVGSNNTLIPNNDYGNNSKFGRRETLDVNRSSQLIMFGNRDDNNARNSELTNIWRSEDEISQINCRSPPNGFQNMGSKQNNYPIYNNNWRWNKELDSNYSNNMPKWTWSDACKATTQYSNWYDQSYILGQESMRNSHNHSNMIKDCEILEKQLWNQVSNVVSSFLYSKFDPQSNHWRQKSKSEMGFIRNDDMNWSASIPCCRNSKLWNRNWCISDQMILREIDNYSTNYQKSND